jgi:hypothetical protein
LAPNGAGVQIRSLQIDSSVARTAGSFINPTVNCNRITLYDLNLVAPFWGIHIPNIALCTLRDVDIANTVASTGVSIVVDGGFAVLLDNVICRNSTCFAHLQINNINDITLTNCQFIQGGNCMNITPGNGQIVGLLLSNNTQFDAPQTGPAIRVAPSGTGTVTRVFIDNAWINQASGQDNVVVTNAGGGTVNGFTVSNSIVLGSGSGTGLDLVGVSNVSLVNSRIGSHGTAVSIASSNNVRLIGNRLGPTDGLAGNTNAILLSGTSDFYDISGNDLSGNTVAISNSASGTNGYIGGNVGYPTIGVSAVTVGASPWTYTAGPSPETLFINAGTVSLIAVAGAGVLQNGNVAIPLGPNESMTVTYSATPTVVKSINR